MHYSKLDCVGCLSYHRHRGAIGGGSGLDGGFFISSANQLCDLAGPSDTQTWTFQAGIGISVSYSRSKAAAHVPWSSRPVTLGISRTLGPAKLLYTHFETNTAVACPADCKCGE